MNTKWTIICIFMGSVCTAVYVIIWLIVASVLDATMAISVFGVLLSVVAGFITSYKLWPPDLNRQQLDAEVSVVSNLSPTFTDTVPQQHNPDLDRSSAHLHSSSQAEKNVRSIKKVKIIRPAAAAALYGLGFGISGANKTPSVQYGIEYLTVALISGLGLAVILSVATILWQCTRKLFFRQSCTVTDDSSTSASLSVESKRQHARSSILVFGWLILTVVAVILLLRRSSDTVDIFIWDALAVAGLVTFVMTTKSAIGAVILCILFAIGSLATGYNKFYGGDGGRNLFLSLLLLWAGLHMLYATIRGKSVISRNSVSHVDPQVSVRAVTPDQPASTLEQRLSDLRQLYDKGLISSSIYDQRQSEILRQG